jgi:hypothetical protein
MKKNLFILLITVLLLKFNAYCQDSLRTRNDKPGTPQSLRTPDNTPESQVKIINPTTIPNQAIDHGATESNQASNTSVQANGAVISTPQVKTSNNGTNNLNSASYDTAKSRKSNITNPIRK